MSGSADKGSFVSAASSCFIPYAFLCSVRFDFPRKRILPQGGAERSGFSVIVLKWSVNGCRKTRGNVCWSTTLGCRQHRFGIVHHLD